MSKNLAIGAVYLFTNGMLAVFDVYGQQMPEYQGRQRDKLGTILGNAGPSVTFYWSWFERWRDEVSREQVRAFWEMWQAKDEAQ